MNKPPVNAFNLQMYEEIKDTFSLINTMEDIWVVVLRADGKQFSTGNDVNEFLAFNSENILDYTKVVGDSLGSVYECRVPVIAAVNGLSLGAGCALATCADILIASENAMFGIPEVKLCIVGAACFIFHILPQHVARYMSLLGESVTAAQMKHFGVVWEIVPNDRLYYASMTMAQKLSQLPPLALRGFKKSMIINEDARLTEKYATEIGFSKEIIDTEDFKEAINAFVDKRKPIYKGK